jgi:hypothetical protein
MKFPDDWIVGETLPCQICMRNSIEEDAEENEYYGGVGDKVCSQCKRNICPLHFNDKKQFCWDCLELKI